MKKKDIIREKSGGRRIPLYAEVGKYFSADGTFDDAVFRKFIKESLDARRKQHSEKDFTERAGEWLSSYITNILDYLKEKGMSEASFKLIKAAIEESTRAGLKMISIPTEHLKQLISNVFIEPVKEEKKDSSDEKREKIFNAALQVFAREGFHKATMDEIAAKSGVGKGSVYRYFKSKENLLEQLLDDKHKDIIRHISRIFSGKDDVLRQIQEAIEFWVKFIEDNHILYRLIQSEAIAQRSSKSAMFYDVIISHLPMIKERLVALNREKKLKTTSFYTVFYGLLGFIDGVVHKWFRSGMSYPLKDEVPVILEVLFNGFVGEKETHKSFFISPEDEEDIDKPDHSRVTN